MKPMNIDAAAEYLFMSVDTLRDLAASGEVAAQNAAQAVFEGLLVKVALLEKQRDELLAVIKVIEINAEECMDFDEFTAMLVPVDDYHRLIEVVESVKGNQV